MQVAMTAARKSSGCARIEYRPDVLHLLSGTFIENSQLGSIEEILNAGQRGLDQG